MDAPVPRLVTTIGWLCLALPALLFAPTVADAAISLAGVLFLVQCVLEKDFSWARQRWVVLALAFWAFAIARGLTSSAPTESATLALVWIRFAVFVAAMQMTARRWPRFPHLMLWSLGIFSVLGAADTIFQYFAGADVFGRIAPPSRLTGPLSRQAIGILLFLMGLPAIAGMLARAADRADHPLHRAAALTGILLISAAILLSGERAALVLFVPAFIVCAGLVLRPSWRMSIVLVVAVAAIATVFYIALPDVWARHASLAMAFKNPSDSLYLDIWRTAVRVFVDNPLFGIGIHNFRVDCAQYAVDAQRVCGALHPHQYWMEWLAETGIVGTALLAALFVAALKPAVRQWREWPRNPLLAGATVAIAARLLPLAPSHSFFVSQSEVVLWTIVAVVIASGGAGKVERSVP